MKAIDIIIFLPIIPMFLMGAISWFIPYEHWISRYKIPKKYLGPYLLYVLFATWHFKMYRLAVLIAVLGGGACYWAVLEYIFPTKKKTKDEP